MESNLQFSNMSRRKGLGFNMVIVVVCGFIVIFGIYSYHDLHTRLRKAEEVEVRLRQEHESVSAQLQGWWHRCTTKWQHVLSAYRGLSRKHIWMIPKAKCSRSRTLTKDRHGWKRYDYVYKTRPGLTREWLWIRNRTRCSLGYWYGRRSRGSFRIPYTKWLWIRKAVTW